MRSHVVRWVVGVLVLAAIATWLGSRRPVPPPAVTHRSSTPAPEAVPHAPPAPQRFELKSTDPTLKQTAEKSLGVARNNIVKESDGVYAFNSQSYGATLDRGRIEVSPNYSLEGVGAPQISYSLSEIRVGGEVFVTGGSVEATPELDRKAIAFKRGPVAERYLLKSDGLEQTFLITDLPNNRGAVTIVGAVDSNLQPPAEGTRGSSLPFTYKGCEVLSLSKAVAIDADDRRLPLEMAYVGGKVELTLPADWVARARLPILVDPLIGAPVILDSSITAYVTTLNSQFVRVCDITNNTNGGSFMIVWSERVGSSTFDYNIYAQRMDTYGALVGAAISVATSANGEYECAISFALPVFMYLVVWRDDPANNNSSSDQRIMGRLLDSSGGLYGPAMVIDDQPGQDFAPAVAFDTSQWFVASTNVVSSTNYNVRGRFVSTAGLPGAAVLLDSDADMAARPAVAWGGSNYVVAWEKTSGTVNAIVARSMDANGFLPGTITPVSMTPLLDCRNPDVSAGDGKVLIVWQQATTATDRDVLGQVCDDTLRMEGSPKAIFSGPSDQLFPQAAYNWENHAWYVVATDSVTGGTDLYGRWIGMTGILGNPPEAITGNPSADVRPALAPSINFNRFAVIFLTGATSPYQLVAQLVGGPAQLPAGSFGASGAAAGSTSIRWYWGAGFVNLAGLTGYEILDARNFSIAVVAKDQVEYYETNLTPNSIVSRKFRLLQGPFSNGISSPIYGATMVAQPDALALKLTALSGWRVELDVAIPPNGFAGQSGFQGLRSKRSDFVNTDGSLHYVGPGARQIYNCVDTGVVPNSTYYYKFQYVGQTAELSNWSGGQSILTPNAPPTALGGSASSPSNITWTWSWPSTGPESAPNQGFILKNEDGVQVAAVITPTTNSWPNLTNFTGTETGLLDNTRYTRTVHTMWNAKASDPSPALSVYTRVRDATLADFTLTQAPGGIRVDVVPPRSPYAGQTGVHIVRTPDGVTWYNAATLIGQYSFVDSNIYANTQYTYAIAYVNADRVEGVASPTKSINTGIKAPPVPPASFIGTALGPTSIRYTWTASPSAVSYPIYSIETNPNVYLGASTTTSFDRTGLQENRAYWVAATASNVFGQSGYSAYSGAATLVHNATSSDFTVTAVSNARVDVSVVVPVNSGTGQTFYELSRFDGTTWTVLTPSGYTFQDTTVVAGKAYQYRIRYRNTGGFYSGYSPTKTVTTYGAATPTITTGNKKTRNQNTSLTGAAPVGSTVKLYFNGVLEGTASNPSGTWTYSTVNKPAGVYTVQAQASVGTAVSNFSAPITLTIDLTPPSPPTNLRVSAYNNVIDLEWDPSPSTDVIGYRIFRKTGATGTWSMILAYPGYLAGTTKYRDAGVVNGTSYYYHLTSVDDCRND